MIHRCPGRSLGVALLALLIVACSSVTAPEAPLPTLVDPPLYPTHQFLTQNAPPPGFGELIGYQAIDRGVTGHLGWSYTVTAHFEGVNDRSGEALSGRLTLSVQGNEPAQTRRVILQAEGRALLGAEGAVRLEGVRWSNDYYSVDAAGRCTADQGGRSAEAALADLGAGAIIGGVARAVPTGHRQELAGQRAWQYTFAPGDVVLPAVHLRADSQMSLAADLWFAPDLNAVLVYELTATVARVHLLWADQQGATVSGTLYLRYALDVAALGTLPNIAVPHGC